jgi:ribosomal protein L40E
MRGTRTGRLPGPSERGMTDTTCPSCDAPAPAGARSCRRCGYRFLEAGPGPGPRERPSLRPLALYGGALAAAAVAAVLAVGALGGEDGDVARSSARHLDILSEHPVSTPAAERLLKRRYIGTRNDESASVRCSGRVPKPAHSVRRCIVHYPGGIERTVVLLTSANGAEIISKP